MPNARESDAVRILEDEQEQRDEGSDEGSGQDGENSEDGQNDLVSSTPLNSGRGRVGLLTILLAMCVRIFLPFSADA